MEKEYIQEQLSLFKERIKEIKGISESALSEKILAKLDEIDPSSRQVAEKLEERVKQAIKDITHKEVKIQLLKFARLFTTNTAEAENKKDEPNLVINNSILGELRLINCDFSKAEKIKIENSELTDVKFANVNWGEISEKRICPELFKDKPEKARDVYRQLKLAHDNQKDHITANEFYALEMKAYERVLERKSWFDIKYSQKKLVFLLYRFTSTYGQSWAKPLSLITLLTIANTGYQQFYDLNTYLSTLFTSKFFPVVFPLMLGGLTSLALLEIISAKLEAILWFIVIGLALTGITAFHKFPTKSFLDTCAETFNIFKLFGSSANHIKHPFIHTLHAIATAFLIYQIIVAVRRQVRR